MSEVEPRSLGFAYWHRVKSMLYNRQASVLIISIWVLAILAILGTGLARAVSSEISWIGYLEKRMLSLNLAKSAVRQAILEREKDLTPEYDSIYELQSERKRELGRGKFIYSIADEESKININTATPEILIALLNITPEIAEDIYKSEFKPFSLIEEILLVEGTNPEEFSLFKDFATVYTEGKVNINTASAEALEALGLDEELAEIIERFRKGNDAEIATEDDRIFESVGFILSELQEFTILSAEHSQQIISLLSKNLLTVKSQNLCLNIQTEIDNKANKTFSIVLKQEEEEMKVARWEER